MSHCDEEKRFMSDLFVTAVFAAFAVATWLIALLADRLQGDQP